MARVRNERQRVQTTANNAARYAASQRLIAAHRDEYRRLYVEECEKRGVVPARTTGLSTKHERVKPLIEEIAASGLLDGVDVPEEPTLLEKYEAPDLPIVARQRLTRSDQLDARAAGVDYRDARPDYVPVPPPPF